MRKYVILAVVVVMVSMVFSTMNLVDGEFYDIVELGWSVASSSDGDIIIGATGGDVSGVMDAGYVILYSYDEFLKEETQKQVNNPYPDEGDVFGYSVASHDYYRLVGARGDNISGTLNSEPVTIYDGGSAYLFDKFGKLIHEIKNPHPILRDYFGHSVAFTSYGDMIIGAPEDDASAKNAGVVYVYTPKPNEKKAEFSHAYLMPQPSENAYFGISVASTYEKVIVGASGANSVYVFDDSSSKFLFKIINPSGTNDGFGFKVASTPNNNIIVSAPYDKHGGTVYLFDGTDGSRLLTIKNPSGTNDYFGYSVTSISNGDLVVGAPDGDGDAGIVYVFDGNNGRLKQTTHKPNSWDGYGGFGHSVATINDGSKNSIIAGAPYSFQFKGTYYLFDYNPNVLDDTVQLDGLQLFGVSGDIKLYQKVQGYNDDGAVNEWKDLGATGSDIEVAKNADGRLEAFAISESGKVYHTSQTATNYNEWSEWTSLGGKVTEIAVGQNQDGRLVVFGVGSDNGALLYTSQTETNGNEWSGWTSLGGVISDIEIHNYQDRLHVYGIGSDNAVYYTTQSAVNGDLWIHWYRLPTGGVSEIEVVDYNGLPHVFAVGSDHALNEREFIEGSGWTNWYRHGSWVIDFEVVKFADGQPHIFLIDGAGELWQRMLKPDGNWNGWKSLGGELSSLEKVILDENGGLHIFGIDNGVLVQKSWLPTDGWSGWNDLSEYPMKKNIDAILVP